MVLLFPELAQAAIPSDAVNPSRWRSGPVIAGQRLPDPKEDVLCQIFCLSFVAHHAEAKAKNFFFVTFQQLFKSVVVIACRELLADILILRLRRFDCHKADGCSPSLWRSCQFIPRRAAMCFSNYKNVDC